MKRINWSYVILVFITISIFLSSYFYPTTRDEFYYLPNTNVPDLFTEFNNAYHTGNPRLGQFFANLIGRNPLAKPFFTIFLFWGYISVLFLFAFRRLPKVNDTKDAWKILIFSASFVLLIGGFGEMFYYVPFSTNYTLTHIFYLAYLYLLSEYYFYDKNLLKNKKKSFMLAFVGVFFMGWCNEHVPPVLLGGGILLALFYILKNKKLPHFKILLLNLPLLFGYLVLFLAPANRIKFKVTGAKEFGFQWSEYVKHWMVIFKTYYYFNTILLIIFLLTIGIVILNLRKINKVRLLQVAFYFLLSVLTLFIVAYSPLQGTRLLLFSNTLIIIGIYLIVIESIKYYSVNRNVLQWSSVGILILFFSFSIYVTYRAQQNFQEVMTSIDLASKKSKNVQLNNSFDFTQDIPFARKIILDRGSDYIDSQPENDGSIEMLLKTYFKLETISSKEKAK